MSEIVTLPVKNGEYVADRHEASVEAMKRREREDFDRWYQAQCDSLYWTRGQCCAGCDHWITEAGMIGQCNAAGLVSGLDVVRSLGITFCSYDPGPGLPFTPSTFHCGKFSDEFDWSTLDADYLQHIGATRNGQLKPKPDHAHSENQT